MEKGKKKSKGEIDPAQQEEQEHQILKAMNTAQLKIKITEFRNRVNSLIVEIKQVATQLKKEQRQFLQTSYQMQKQVQVNDQTVNSLLQQFNQNRNMNKALLQKFYSQKQLELQQLQAKLNKELSLPKNKLKDLQEKRQLIKIFQNQQFQLQLKKQALQRKLQQSKEKQLQDLKKMAKKNQQEKKVIQEENVNQYKKIKAEQLKQVRFRLGLNDVKVKIQNSALQQQIQLYSQQKRLIQEQISSLKQQTTQLNDKKQQNDQQRQNYVLQTHKANTKIKRLKDKQKQFQVHIKQEMDRLSNQLQQFKAKSQSRVKDKIKQLKSMEELLRIKSKQLRNLKSLCQIVLDQRSPIQQFFIEVIIKESPKLDIVPKDLRDEDRDRLLRQLFIKINSGAPPTNWRQFSVD